MFAKGLLLSSILVLYVPEELLTREIHYNVPRELRDSFMSPTGPYPQFQGIDCNQPVEMKTSCRHTPLRYRWHWDHYSKSCERIPYFGCQPTRNNFYASSVCNAVARPICTRLPDDDRYAMF